MVLSSSASVSDPGVAPEVRRATAAWRESGEKTTFEEVAEEGSEERSCREIEIVDLKTNYICPAVLGEMTRIIFESSF